MGLEFSPVLPWRLTLPREVSRRELAFTTSTPEFEFSVRTGLAVDPAGRAIGMTEFGPRRRVLVIPSATIARVAAEPAAGGTVNPQQSDIGGGIASDELHRHGVAAGKSLEAAPIPVGALVLAMGAEDGAPTAALGVVSRSAGPWRSVRGGEIDARIELDLRLRRRLESHGRIPRGYLGLGLPFVALEGGRSGAMVMCRSIAMQSMPTRQPR